jgi:DNA uptake protein ComE-like DNA-binding protein
MAGKMRVIAAIVFFLLLLAAWPVQAVEEKIDLNAATLEQLRALPISAQQAEAIYEHIRYEGPFSNIYELSDLPEIDAATLAKLRDLVRVNPPRPEDERIQRIEDAYYRIENLGTEEGTNVGLVDEWIDRLAEPLNVNDASLDELMDLQNVSPADAVAIYNQVKRQGGIRGQRDLRAVPGLSDWGYRNARNYLGYDPTLTTGKLHGSYTFRSYNTPFFSDEELAVDPAKLVDPRPDESHKLRLTYDRRYKAGILWHRNLGEKTYYANDGSFQIPEMKWFAGIEKFKLGPVRIDRAYVGDYQVSFGQGLVMESGDYFSPRYSGFSYDKRITGIAPDLSRSREFTLHGAAFESYYGPLKAVGFISAQNKDAITNPDGSLNRLINLVPRDDRDIYPTWQKTANADSVEIPAFAGTQSMIRAVKEVGVGGELSFRPWTGTSIGLAATQFMYNKPLKPDLKQGYLFDAMTRHRRDSVAAHPELNLGTDTTVFVYPIIDPTQIDEIAGTPPNPEATSAYYSNTGSSLWGGSQSVRRVYGLNLMSVVNNYTFQFEYAELEKSGKFLKAGDDPHALVASAHAQWNSFSILALYRDYSVDYDNPYNRGFSNYSRYKGTTFEDEFYLSQPVFAQLQRNAPTPQAERGVYVESRYQVSRAVTLDSEIDNWTRVADQADYYRWVAKVQYRPVWPLVIRIRQKLQGRWHMDPPRETGFMTYENRINLEFRLSRFDNLQLLYANGYTRFTPRPRLIGEVGPTGSSPLDAQTASPTEAVGVQMTHYFSPKLRVRGAWIVYDGFFWNFEDSDFAVVDGKSARWFFSISDRLSDHLSVRFKLTGDSSHPKTWVQSRDSNQYPTIVPGRVYTGEDVTKDQLSFRIQLDYMF